MAPPRPASRFLTAQWRQLVMLNYEVQPSLLTPLVPAGTELDAWRDRFYISLVAFLFLDTRVLGVPIPFHRDFEEVNLRFYVRRQAGEELRRGVVFIKEVVPRPAIAWVARTFYNENYVAMPMWHRVGTAGNAPHANYGWGRGSNQCELELAAVGEPQPTREGSEEQFITEHYWGYTRQRDGTTLEYQVEHPPWRVWSASRAEIRGDLAAHYGADLARVLQGAPRSAFLAEGSEVAVRRGNRIGQEGAEN